MICSNTERIATSSKKMAHSTKYLEEASIHQIGYASYEVETEEDQTIYDVNNMEERVCNLSEILQQPNTSVLTVNPAELFLHKESPSHVYMINTLVVKDEQMISTNRDEIEEVKHINIVGSNTRELRPKNSMPTFKPIRDRVALPRAQAVLPRCLQYRNGVVLPKSHLPEFALFGPVEGIIEMLSGTEAWHLVCECAVKARPVFLIPNEDGHFMHIDVSDQDKSNWIGLLSLGDNETANVWLHLIETKIYAVTTSSIDNTTPLAIGYTRNYAEELGIPDCQPILDLNEELKKERTEWRCKKCVLSMSTIKELERHNAKYHSKNPDNSRKRRCRFCLRYFQRIFCFRRHVKRCLKNPANENSFEEKSSETDLSALEVRKNSQKEQKKKTWQHTPETAQIYEEPRLPSDESLQNYTNILDISTNLFDADRMLDVSTAGSFKFDDYDKMPAEFDFSDRLFSSSPKKTKKAEVKSMSPVTCPYCKTTVTRSKFRQHAHACPSRVFVCHCGKKFRTKNGFAMHMLKIHRGISDRKSSNISADEQDTRTITTEFSTLNDAKELFVDDLKSDPVLPKNNETEVGNENEVPMDGGLSNLNNTELADSGYQCQECSLVFKRHGMLVLHLARSHKITASAATAPLVVTQKKYPCPRCPKFYSTAQKRKLHVATHHPGVKPEEYRTEGIELSRQKAEPARCWACPRQYTTRAKLLQHARAHHPHQEPPSSSPAVPQKKSKLK